MSGEMPSTSSESGTPPAARPILNDPGTLKLPLALGGGFGYKEGLFQGSARSVEPGVGGIEQAVEFEAGHAI
jgi:hypothetical protein